MRKIKLSLTVCLLALAASSEALAQQGGQYYGPHMSGGMGWWMFLGPLMGIVFIAAIVTAGVLIVRSLSGASSGRAPQEHPQPSETALDILKKRYAKGEIDKEEFEEKRRLVSD